MNKRILCMLLCAAMLLGTLSVLGSCGQRPTKPDALVVMTDALDGVFNPFYSTTASDGTIVAMTQIAMLTTGYENGQVTVACGPEEAVVAMDYAIEYDDIADTTTYTFVIKNDILYSDGEPLTIEDVLFNMYVYLDPVYTGSSTMYSTDIVGLQNYRTQTRGSGTDDTSEIIAELANTRAKNRINELINLYKQVGRTDTAGSYSADYDTMIAAIAAAGLSKGYKEAISSDHASVTTDQLRKDYEKALEEFKKELESDYTSASSAYTETPYKETGEFDEITSFMFAEGFVTIEFEKDPVTNKDIKTQIKKVTRNYSSDVVTSKEKAIEYVYNQKIEQELHIILQYWATANTLMTEYSAQATTVILRENMSEDGTLLVPNIAGIVSLGHTTDVFEVEANNGTYTVAHEHNPDGTPVNRDEYDVLQITINGVDPKAIWNFAFSVAPQHYYGQGYTVDIPNNKFGVDYGSFDFMSNTIRASEVTKVPVGAGPYKATNRNNEDNPKGADFYVNNIVYFKANDKFMMGTPKIEKLRYQVVSATNALDTLEKGEVHFVTPQYTQENIERINNLGAKGIQSTYTDQLGYGYIGINAGKVPDINLRKAIMCAMNIDLALEYYSTGTASTIYWPMSTVSWAYPTEDGIPSRDNGHEYPAINFNREIAKQTILDYMAAAGVSEGDSQLSITFTIAGADLTDHPAYKVFESAQALLNECGWDIEIVPDTQALTKLSTGSLAVWAAAWGTTVDPDMYQVYHKNSTASSTLAWGYREILAAPAAYPEENAILDMLSEVIDMARETTDQEERTELYKEAMGYVLDLAIELPVYQRKTLYAYNANVIDASSLPSEINPYTSPLEHIWEIEFAQ